MLFFKNLSRLSLPKIMPLLSVLLLMTFSWTANAAIAINVPATDADGTYTVSWTGMRDHVTLDESINNGVWSQIYGGTLTSKSFTGKPDGTYSYRVNNFCPVTGGPPTQCEQSTKTVVVGTPAPIVSPISNISISEDSNAQVTVSVAYSGSSSLDFTASSTNTALINNTGLVLVEAAILALCQ